MSTLLLALCITVLSVMVSMAHGQFDGGKIAQKYINMFTGDNKGGDDDEGGDTDGDNSGGGGGTDDWSGGDGDGGDDY